MAGDNAMQTTARPLRFIGAASGSGGRDSAGNAAAPTFAEPRLLSTLPGAQWAGTVHEPPAATRLAAVAALCAQLADAVSEAMAHDALPVVVGGDHSCAVGTWSGVSAFLQRTAPAAANFGLLWVDAHMDSHTFDTSDSGNIHGMPLAALLGDGNAALTALGGTQPKLRGEHVVLFGVRSYEPGEAHLLQAHGVRVFTMREIAQRGVQACFAEAVHRVSQAPAGFGLTFDLDALDPQDAPATCCHEPGGLRLDEMLQALALLPRERLLAAEFVELNAQLPGAERTVQAMAELIRACVQPTQQAAHPEWRWAA